MEATNPRDGTDYEFARAYWDVLAPVLEEHPKAFKFFFDSFTQLIG